jgi:hypothetical protein
MRLVLRGDVPPDLLEIIFDGGGNHTNVEFLSPLGVFLLNINRLPAP